MMQRLDRIAPPARNALAIYRERSHAERGHPHPLSTFAVVLFTDIIGFTRLCEELDPAEAFALLSDFHQHMARQIAAHDAAIEDYIGDGVMAVWTGSAAEAGMLRRALSCGFAMRDAMDRWNRNRANEGCSAIRVGVGMHAGAVMVGRTGMLGCGKLGAFGDTVNVANRLERMTRVFGTDFIVSDDFFRTVAAVAPAEKRLTRFHAMRKAHIPGRAGPVLIRTARPV